MNRFRTKKKGKDTNDVGVNDSESPTPLKQSMTFRRAKKAAPEPEQKLELDLANALPSSDDFRTSLLMSGLSARFSMLREQDNPNSKIGKASDDSVLFPKRQSRLHDFGFSSKGLSDIAEVASIKSSIRPPFLDRADSYYSTEGYGTDDDFANGGNIMARAKPASGNNLFGGRQKIYKIPMNGSASMKNLGSNGEERQMAGRALYDDDVSQSAFQKLRERAKQEQEREQWAVEESAQISPPRRSHSPIMTGYNRNRETSSTTASGPSLTRSSTAATSVTSQRAPSVNGYSSPSTPAIPNQTNGSALDRSATKAKRLYETGLDQHLHNQQHSAMSRLDSLSRHRPLDTRTPSPGLPSPVNATFDIPEISGLNTRHNFPSSGPTPTGHNVGAFDFGVKSSNGLEAPKQAYMSPPLSPPMSEGDDQSNLPIQPNDRGKATALGAFSKPAQPYDENKYSQRQLQMQEGRGTPPPRTFHSGQQAARSRAESNSTYSSGRSRSSSSAQREFVPHNRFAPVTVRKEAPTSDNHIGSTGTFLSSPNGSSMSSPREDAFEIGKPWGQAAQVRAGLSNLSNANLSAERPPESEHPANRQRSPRLWADYTNIPDEMDKTVITNAEISGSLSKDEDSPTLGPATGLSGMVRQHLRSESNNSEYGPPSPARNYQFSAPELPVENQYKDTGNPWEVNDWDQDYYGQRDKFSHISPKSIKYTEPGSDLSSPTKNVNRFPGALQTNGNSSWEMDAPPNIHHTRDGSTETQKERDDFATELATRRRRVQENLRSFAEPDSRSQSPAPSMDRSRDASMTRNNPLGMLKSKSSRGSIVARSKDGQSKAMKMLGLSAPSTTSAPSPSASMFDDNLWKQEEEEMLRGVVKSPRAPPPTKAYRQARRDAQRDRERDVLMRHQHRAGAESSDSDAKPVGSIGHLRAASPIADETVRDAPQLQPTLASESQTEIPRAKRAPSEESKRSAATNQSGSGPESRPLRDRSSSDVSGRSKSRNGRYRDDLAKAMAEGAGSSAQSSLEEVNRMPARSPAPGFGFQDTGSMPSPSFNNRSRSNSKSGYFDSHQLQPIQTNHRMDIGTSPRPSPITPYSVNSTPALVQPSPVGSGSATPTGQGFQSQGRIPAARKRSVNKSEISEPTLLSMTSRITTVNLPPGASLSNGSTPNAPPVPPINPRRRQTRNMFGALTGRSAENLPTPSLPILNYSNDELSNFSADEAETRKPRQKLRKSSSEGGNLNARARAAFTAQPSPAMPGVFPPGAGEPQRVMQDGMF